VIVVIPSNRQVDLSHLTPLIEAGARFIVVDDSDGRITVDHPQFEVYNWGDRRKMLGGRDALFPRRNGSCRSFGFYVAWRESNAGEAIVALDDDCRAYHPDFAARVEATLSRAPRPVASCPGEHLNILKLYSGVPEGLYPRGFPYSQRVKDGALSLGADASRDVTFSLGMWRGVFDVNAIDKIHGPPCRHPDAELRHPSVIVDAGKLVYVCSMYMVFRRELIPAAFQLPMHVEVMPGWRVDRYGDIWGGFILKRLMDLRGESMAVGEPMVLHLRGDDYLHNIWQEHLAHLVNDEFLDVLGRVRDQLVPGDYLGMMTALARLFRENAGACSPILAAYLQHLCPALDAWTGALSEAS